MTILAESILVESKTARESHLNKFSHERALETLNKAKALLMALWKGTGVTTTEEIVRYYEVESSVIRHASKQHRDELLSDGWQEVRGKESLKVLRDIGCEAFSLPQATTRVAIWTPRAALRLGMLLRDSEVAKTIRTALLDAVEKVIPTQAQELERLKLELEIIRAKQRYQDTAQAILTTTSPGMLAYLRGDASPPVKIEYRDRFVDTATGKEIDSQSGRSLSQLIADAGLNPKSTRDRHRVKKILKCYGWDYECALGWSTAAYLREYQVLPDEIYNQALQAVLTELTTGNEQPNLFVYQLQQASVTDSSDQARLKEVQR